MFFLGIDVSISRVEAVALDSKTGKAHTASEEFTPLANILRNKPVQPRAAWEKVVAVVGKLLREQRIKGDDIVGIAVTSTEDAWVPVGENLEPLHPIINIQLSPFDSLSNHDNDLFKINGRGERILSGVNNLEWFRRSEPEAYSRMFKWLGLAEYIGAKLTGAVATDAAAAAHYGMLDIKERKWSELLMARFGVKQEHLPEIAPPGEVMGRLTRRAAAEIRLKQDTPVIVASSGPACAAVACNLAHCSCLNVMAENELLLTRLSADQAFTVNPADGYSLEPHIGGSDYLAIGMLPFVVPTYLWVIENLFPNLAGRPLGEALASLQSKVDLIPPGSDGLLFLPHLVGSGTPKADPHSRGVIVGLRPDHTRWHIYRAALEGVAYELRANLQTIAKATGREITTISAQGWGAENRVAVQIKSDATGIPFAVNSVNNGSACGAALLAAKGLGHAEVAELYRVQASRTGAVYSPNVERKGRYSMMYTRVYSDLYNSLEEVFPKLS